MSKINKVQGLVLLMGTWLLSSSNTNLDYRPCDTTGNMNRPTNNALLQRFNVNRLDELTTVTKGGRLTVANRTT